jgi:peptidoglycan/xylan/chitin deacetylase (PgdA/CDA1 family)
VIPVLLYHAVDDRPPANGSWAVSRAQFARHMELIASSGREPIKLTALAAGLRAEHPLPERAVAITFDDGYADTYDAVALLAGRGLVCTVYVTTAEIGEPDRLSAAQLVELARMPAVELGAHAVHHSRLDELDERAVTAEIRASKGRLEDLTGARIESFAYPHGAYDDRVRGAVIAGGYRSAAAVKNAVSHRGDDPFAIARWTVTAATSAERLAEVLEGKDVAVAWTRERLRTRAYRMARRQRRHLFGAGNAPC